MLHQYPAALPLPRPSGAREPAVFDNDGLYLGAFQWFGEIDVVAHLFEYRHGVGRYAGLHFQAVRPPLMMETRQVVSVLRAHMKIDNVKNTSVTAVMMREPPGAPRTMASLPSLSAIVGIMDESGRLPG